MDAAVRRAFELARGGGDAAELYGILRRHPTIIHIRDSEGCTALHATASAGSVDVGQLLLQAGASPRDIDKDGWEPLHYSCANGHFGMAVWLLQNGAQLSSTTEDGWQPVHVAAHTGQTQLARLLAAQGADLLATTKKGENAIHLATEVGALGFVQWLMRATAGEAARAVDHDGWRPLHNAAHAGNLQLLKLFANLPDTHIDMRTGDGCTPLHLAANAGNVEEATWLLKKGADANALTADGLTAEYLAALGGHKEMQALLGPATDADQLAGAGGTKSAGLRARPPTTFAKLTDRQIGDGASSAGAADDVGLASAPAADGTRTPPLQPMREQHESPGSKSSKMSLSTTVLINEATSRLATELRTQAAHYIDSTLSRALLIKHLKLDLAAVMEKGKIYQPLGSAMQVVTWRLRYFFCSDTGLCYQKVNSRRRPIGEKRLVPWSALSKVEVLHDDSIYLATVGGKTYYIKLKDAEEPAAASWTWATRLCQLCQLLGNEVTGCVADQAYSPALAAAAASSAAAAIEVGPPSLPATELLSTRLPPPSALAPAKPKQAAAYTNLAAVRGPPADLPMADAPGAALPDGDDLEDDESDESPEEAYRRRQWILYYISIGEYQEAEDIGWDRVSPPDPRAMLSQAVLPKAEEASASGADDKEAEKEELINKSESKSTSSSSKNTPRKASLTWLNQKMDEISPAPSSRAPGSVAASSVASQAQGSPPAGKAPVKSSLHRI